MGACASVVCFKCKIQRDLDKFYDMRESITNRAEATAKAEDLDKKQNLSAFRYILLANFMQQHEGHPCTIYWDDVGAIDESFYTYPDDGNKYWNH